jgi:bifunctional non-homologous end joining protein LigD
MVMPQKQRVVVDGRELAISNVNKVYYPGSGFTKGEVIAYYDAIAHTIVPHLRDRPLTLKRYPEGVEGEYFYEKNAPSYAPAWVKTFAVPRSEGGADICYLLCNDRATLIWTTSLADIEKHVLLSRAPDLHRPTSLVFDLDPGEPATILDCARVALHLKVLFDAWALQSFVKVSGSKGLHVSVPLNSEATYEVTQPFARALAELVAKQMPQRVVSEMAKAARRGKVFIDWSQNSAFKTTVCVYAMRAKHAEPFISMPLSWNELASAVKRGDEARLFFTPAAAVKRIRRVGDLFAPVLTLRQQLPPAFTEALAAAPPVRLASWPKRDKSLRAYRAKRDPTRTLEPSAKTKAASKRQSGCRFVIQKHKASHLHYDFRLEMEGVLRSWAVPKGPPMKMRETRLAVHVEDHPLDYADFEGTIPPGNYGAGTVMIWDVGEYDEETGNAAAAFHRGKMHVTMRGTKLQGEWILVKDRHDEEGSRWLLIKAQAPQRPIPATLDDTSAKSGRSMRQIADANDAQWTNNQPGVPTPRRIRQAKLRAEPAYIEPMQCKAVAELPAEGQWTFELKFDGYRAIAVKSGFKVTLYSRVKNVLNERFPKLIEALRALPSDFVIDGEIVALDPQGRPSFQLLQNSRSKTLPVFFYAFDLLYCNGQTLDQSPVERRREHLHKLISAPVDPLRLSPLLQAPAKQILEAVHQLGLEGVVGKRLGSTYEPGKRSGAWIKHRTNREQEFVIGGYVPGAHGFDRLLIGIYEKRHLVYVAKVKNGFGAHQRIEIFAALRELHTTKCPFTNLPQTGSKRWGEVLTAEKMKECRWVKPQLVCQIAFVEWTNAGNLRHCTFIAMREDKPASEVVRQT